MTIRRREFLGVGAASFVSLAGRAAAPGLFARAAAASQRAAANDHALVVVELTGGNDGLNTVIPYEDPLYYRNRRTLALPAKDVIRLGAKVGLHPRMSALGALYKEGRVAVVQGVGYPDPNRSHFRSMEIWQTASTDPKAPDAGWLGRLLDADDRGAPPFPRGLALTGGLPQAFQSARAVVPVMAELDEVTDEAGSRLGRARRKLSAGTAPAPAPDGPVGFLRRQAETLYRTADRLKQATEAVKDADGSAAYPDAPLAAQLRRAAKVLAADLGVRVLYCAQDGYDTHADQADEHGALLETLSGSLAGFQKDLSARGLADRVAVLVFSEFGRRVDENGSKGTDHGAASVVFVVGPKVKAGLAGTYPSLAKLGDGDLVFSTDFRSVYASVLGRWLGAPVEPVLGQAYPPLELF